MKTIFTPFSPNGRAAGVDCCALVPFLLCLAGCIGSEPPLPPHEALAKAGARIDVILREERVASIGTISPFPGQNPAEPSKVRFWFYTNPVMSELTKRLDVFTRSHPGVSLSAEPLGPWEIAVQKLTVNIAVGDIGDLPDVALIDRAWLPRLAASGRIVPLDSFLPTSLIEDIRVPSRAALTFQGRLYALPGDGFCSVLFYNKALLPGGPPATWDELRRTAESIDRKDGNLEAIGDFPFLESLWSAGGMVCDDQHSGLTAPEAYEALDFVLGLRNDGLVYSATLGDPDSAFQLFITGRVAMTVAASSYLFAAANASFPVGVAPVPGKTGPISALNPGALVVFGRYAEAKHSSIADVLDFLTGPEIQGASAVAIGSVPVRESVATALEVPEGLDQAYQKSRFTPLVAPWSAIEYELNRYLYLAYRRQPPEGGSGAAMTRRGKASELDQ